jgi:hypothetical protein
MISNSETSNPLYQPGKLLGNCFHKWSTQTKKRTYEQTLLLSITSTYQRQNFLRQVLNSWRVTALKKKTASFVLAEAVHKVMRRKCTAREENGFSGVFVEPKWMKVVMAGKKMEELVGGKLKVRTGQRLINSNSKSNI